jgi:hypothetical protein
MSMPHVPASLWWIVAPFVAWRVYVRLRRLLARQKCSMWRHGGSIVGLLLLTSGIAFVAAEEHRSLMSLAAGLVLGAIAGAWGLRITEFEPRADGLYFTPDRFLGGALSLLLVCRIGWRLVEGPSQGAGWSLDEFVQNPSTLFLYGLFSGHYITYAAGLLFWAVPRFRRQPTPPNP